jgi:IS5 family transposase
MRPKERRDGGQNDLFNERLDRIGDMGHPLARLAATIDWRFLEERFGAVYSDRPSQPPLPTRLMAGLSILKHTHNLSDEELCARFLESPYYQLFCGEDFFVHKPPFDRSSLIGERKGRRALAVGPLAERPAILPRHPDRMPCLGKLVSSRIQVSIGLFRSIAGKT